MTAEVNRPSETRTIANLMERVRILESQIPGSGSGGSGCCDPTIVNPGNIVIDDQFAGCVALGWNNVQFPDTVIGFTPAPTIVPGTLFPVGPARCNYEAGFRIQINFGGNWERVQVFTQLFHGTGGTATPVGSPTPLSFPPGVVTPTVVHTPWNVSNEDLSTTGALGDTWSAAIYAQNNSLISNGLIGGIAYARYVPAGDRDAGAVPPPTEAGQLARSVAGGGNFFWELLPKGTNGQVLTMVSGLPEWV